MKQSKVSNNPTPEPKSVPRGPQYRYFSSTPETVTLRMRDLQIPEKARASGYDSEQFIELPCQDIFSGAVPGIRLARLAELAPDRVTAEGLADQSIKLCSARLALAYVVTESRERLEEPAELVAPATEEDFSAADIPAEVPPAPIPEKAPPAPEAKVPPAPTDEDEPEIKRFRPAVQPATEKKKSFFIPSTPSRSKSPTPPEPASKDESPAPPAPPETPPTANEEKGIQPPPPAELPAANPPSDDAGEARKSFSLFPMFRRKQSVQAPTEKPSAPPAPTRSRIEIPKPKRPFPPASAATEPPAPSPKPSPAPSAFVPSTPEPPTPAPAPAPAPAPETTPAPAAEPETAPAPKPTTAPEPPVEETAPEPASPPPTVEKEPVATPDPDESEPTLPPVRSEAVKEAEAPKQEPPPTRIEPDSRETPQPPVASPPPVEPSPSEDSPAVLVETEHMPRGKSRPDIGDQDGLQAVFMTEEFLSVERVLELCCDLPGIHSCVLSQGARIIDSRNTPDSVDIVSLSAHALEMLKAMRSSAAKMGIGAVPAVTVHSEKGPITFFHDNDLCLLVLHKDRGFVPGVREKLQKVVDELGQAQLPVPAGKKLLEGPERISRRELPEGD